MADIRPGDSSICPRCGNGGPAIKDFEGTLPMLDPINGYPMYFCRSCGRPFTGLTRPDELTRESEGKRRLELKDLLPPPE